MGELTMRDWVKWWRAAGIRAVKTAAQSAMGAVTLGVAAADINWFAVGGIALTSALYSLLTSLAGLPEEHMDTEKNMDQEGGSGVGTG